MPIWFAGDPIADRPFAARIARAAERHSRCHLLVVDTIRRAAEQLETLLHHGRRVYAMVGGLTVVEFLARLVPDAEPQRQLYAALVRRAEPLLEVDAARLGETAAGSRRLLLGVQDGPASTAVTAMDGLEYVVDQRDGERLTLIRLIDGIPLSAVPVLVEGRRLCAELGDEERAALSLGD